MLSYVDDKDGERKQVRDTFLNHPPVFKGYSGTSEESNEIIRRMRLRKQLLCLTDPGSVAEMISLSG